MTPPQFFVGSFALLVALGTAGLMFLPGLYSGAPLRGVDALFTATSAVCVTGLIVVDTSTYFTWTGQLFLLFLIQAGGLGMITFTTLIILAIGRRLSLRQESLAGTPEFVPRIDVGRLALDIVRLALIWEGVGAALLFLLWLPRFGPAEAAWHGIFHAVSAFCNAGFSTFHDSLCGSRDHAAVLIVIMALIVVGGLGFLTLEELGMWRGARRRNQSYRISLHTRIVLATTAVLLAAGSIVYTAFEWRLTLADLSPWLRGVNGLFMSVTARTAGFSAIDYSGATDSTNFLTILLMSVGGSPGSAAGGLKTTTVALIAMLAWSRLRGRRVVSAWGRSVPEETLHRSVGLMVVATGIVTAAIFVYTATEIGYGAARAQGMFLHYMFEAASAFGTVGLSLGATAELSHAGKILTILLMFLGRVGPLTFAAAIALRNREPERRFRYAHEDVIVG